MAVDLELAPKTKRPAVEPCCEPVVYPDVDRDRAVRMAELIDLTPADDTTAAAGCCSPGAQESCCEQSAAALVRPVLGVARVVGRRGSSSGGDLPVDVGLLARILVALSVVTLAQPLQARPLALFGRTFPRVGLALAPIGLALALVREPLARIGDALATIRHDLPRGNQTQLLLESAFTVLQALFARPRVTVTREAGHASIMAMVPGAPRRA